MKTIYSEPNKGVLEHDAERKLFVMHWYSFHGPHYRKAIDALLAALKEHGGRAYISDSSRPTDVQSQEDLKYVTSAAAVMVKAGIKEFVVVQPRSAIAKMGARRVAQVASDSGVSKHEVATLDEALQIARAA
jgi:hypothetical protein